MFGLSFFTSKSGLSIFSSLLIIISIFYVDWKAFAKEKWLVLFVMSLPLGMFLNLFSLGGWESSLKFFLGNPWPLMVIPGFHLIKQNKELRFFLWPLSISLAAAMLKSASIFYFEHGLVFNSRTRVQSFFDIGRWGQFVGAAAIALMGLSYSSIVKTRKLTLYVWILFALTCVSLMLSNTRGPWLGFVVGAIFTALAMRRFYKTFVFLAAGFTVVVCLNDGVLARVNSIFKVERDTSGRVTSQDGSNAGRLHMWKVALDRLPQYPFFGTGFGNSEEPMKVFLRSKNSEYLERYTGIEFSYNDAHSSYLQSLLEMGIIFAIYFWGLLGSYFLCLAKKIWFEKVTNPVVSSAMILFNLVLYIFYSSYAGYEAILLSVAFLIVYVDMSGSISGKAKFS